MSVEIIPGLLKAIFTKDKPVTIDKGDYIQGNKWFVCMECSDLWKQMDGVPQDVHHPKVRWRYDTYFFTCKACREEKGLVNYDN